jgi:hypothetical protein
MEKWRDGPGREGFGRRPPPPPPPPPTRGGWRGGPALVRGVGRAIFGGTLGNPRALTSCFEILHGRLWFLFWFSAATAPWQCSKALAAAHAGASDGTNVCGAISRGNAVQSRRADMGVLCRALTACCPSRNKQQGAGGPGGGRGQLFNQGGRGNGESELPSTDPSENVEKIYIGHTHALLVFFNAAEEHKISTRRLGL